VSLILKKKQFSSEEGRLS